jgi:hypothetical protein
MDDSSYRRNSDLDKKNEIHYHSWKEHLKMSKIAKFGCELLWNEENIALWSLKILYIFGITRGKNNHFWAESCYFYRA